MSDPVQHPKIGRSDHYCILVKRHAIEPTQKPYKQSYVVTYNLADSESQWITSHSWIEFYSANSCQEKFDIFQRTIIDALDRFCPTQVIRLHWS